MSDVDYQKRAQALEAEAEAARRRIAGNIDILRQRLSPRTLVDEAVDAVSDRASATYHDVRAAIAEHRYAAGASLAGIAALLFRRRLTSLFTSRARPRQQVEDFDMYPDWPDEPEATSSDRTLGDRVAAVRDAAGERIDALRSSTRDMAGKAQERARTSVDDSPLGVIGAGIVIGAIAGMLLPRTRFEDDRLAGAGQRLHGAIDDAMQTAGQASRSALSDLGLTLDNAFSRIGDIVWEIASAALSAMEASAAAAATHKQPEPQPVVAANSDEPVPATPATSDAVAGATADTASTTDRVAS